jgi:small subunit ribosomal protein S1
MTDPTTPHDAAEATPSLDAALVAEAPPAPEPVAEATADTAAHSVPVSSDPAPAAEAAGTETAAGATEAEAVATETAATETAATEAAPTAAPTEPALPEQDENGLLAYVNGDIVPGTVSVTRADGLDVALDGGRTAVVPAAEFAAGATYETGQAIEGTVIRRQGTGRYVISPKRASKTRAWARIVAAQESGEVMTGVVTEAVKGGVIVDLGIRAFLPESLIDVRRVGKASDLIGQTVQVLVIEAAKHADRPGERIVVSRKPLMEQVRASQRAQLIATLQPGDRRTGRVSALVPFGAFVDLGGVEGLVHVSELAHRQVATPDQVVKVGDEVDVVVLEVNPERKKISLSRKRALPDPWSAFQSAHGVGDLVYGTVTGLATFGAFVKIDGQELEGLVHISELSKFRVEDASEVVAVGEGLWVKILEITPEKKRLSLSLRRALDE